MLSDQEEPGKNYSSERLSPLEILNNSSSSSLLDSLLDAVGSMTRQPVVKIANKIIAIVGIQRHEGAAHHNEFNLKRSNPKLRLPLQREGKEEREGGRERAKRGKDNRREVTQDDRRDAR